MNNFLNDFFGLENKAALVTGGGGAIGRSIALGLAKAGVKVIIADINLEAAKVSVEKIISEKCFATALECDVTNTKSIDRITEKVIQEFGVIDILINSFGISLQSPAENTTDEDWEKVININLNGTFYCCRSVGKYMIKQRKGSIINIASMSGTIANRGSLNASYCASKGGVKMLTKQLAEQWGKYNIRVNSVSPGYIRTPLTIWRVDQPEVKNFIKSVSPMERVGDPQELVGIAIYLASDVSSYMTGADVMIDGGFSVV